MADKEFIDGLIAKKPHDKAPDFVIAGLSIKRKDLGNWLRKKDDEWINADIKVSRAGKWYVEVNTYNAKAEKASLDSFDDDFPF